MTEVKRGMGNELVKSSNKKSVETVAKEVIAGKWGKGGDRKKRLQAAGSDIGRDDGFPVRRLVDLLDHERSGKAFFML